MKFSNLPHKRDKKLSVCYDATLPLLQILLKTAKKKTGTSKNTVTDTKLKHAKKKNQNLRSPSSCSSYWLRPRQKKWIRYYYCLLKIIVTSSGYNRAWCSEGYRDFFMNSWGKSPWRPSSVSFQTAVTGIPSIKHIFPILSYFKHHRTLIIN